MSISVISPQKNSALKQQIFPVLIDPPIQNDHLKNTQFAVTLLHIQVGFWLKEIYAIDDHQEILLCVINETIAKTDFYIWDRFNSVTKTNI